MFRLIRDQNANGLGKDLYDYEVHRVGTVKPQAIDIDGSESERLRQVKTLIQRMTSYKPVHRLPSQLVAQQTALVYKDLEKNKNDDAKGAAAEVSPAHPGTLPSADGQYTTGKSTTSESAADQSSTDQSR